MISIGKHTIYSKNFEIAGIDFDKRLIFIRDKKLKKEVQLEFSFIQEMGSSLEQFIKEHFHEISK